VTPKANTTAVVKETSTQKGNTLPNTATNSANLVLAGLMLILAGTALVYYNRKRKA
jgi:LPXTG-motif cell wall-anchored protein